MSPPSELFDKLLWREFFFVVGGQIPDAHEMINNPISLEIPWEDSVEYLERWKKVSYCYQPIHSSILKLSFLPPFFFVFVFCSFVPLIDWLQAAST